MEFIVILFNSIFITTFLSILDLIFQINNQESQNYRLAYQTV